MNILEYEFKEMVGEINRKLWNVISSPFDIAIRKELVSNVVVEVEDMYDTITEQLKNEL